MTHTNGIIPAFVGRKDEIMTATVLRSARQRAASVAHTLTRRGALAAQAELINEAMCKLIDLVFEPDTDGKPANVATDGRLLIPAPWGRAGHRLYGLRRSEGEALRLYLFRLEREGKPAPLFTYDPTVRSWYLNVYDYPKRAAALAYWQVAQLDAGRWRKCVQALAGGVAGR